MTQLGVAAPPWMGGPKPCQQILGALDGGPKPCQQILALAFGSF